MKLLFDFFPALLFFIAYKIWGIFVATGVLIVASAIQIIIMWVKNRRVEPMHLITFLLILIFGGLTIALHDAMFLKWKVSIVNWLFGAAFLLSRIFMKKPLIRVIFESTNRHKDTHAHLAKLPNTIWLRLNWMWSLFFLGLGTVNIIVVYAFSTSVWVDFKVFGILLLTLVFMIIQTFYLLRQFKQYQ